MKRQGQASIKNFFAKKMNLNRPGGVSASASSDSANVGCSSDNIFGESGVFQSSVSTSRPRPTVNLVRAPAPIADECNKNKVKKHIYDIGNYCQSNSVRALTNEEKISQVQNVWKPQLGYKFPSISDSNHTRSFQMKWLEKFKWLAYSEKNWDLFANIV